MADIIDFGELQLSRSGRRFGSIAPGCEHKHLVLDENGHVVVCTDCKQQVSTWWALNKLVDQYERAQKGLQHRAAAVQEQIKENLHLIAAKRVEKVWRSKMIPACPHCYRGIRHNDGLGSTSIHPQIDERQRKVANAMEKPT